MSEAEGIPENQEQNPQQASKPQEEEQPLSIFIFTNSRH